MLVNLSDVLTSEGRQEKREVSLEMTSFESRLGKFEIVEKSPVSFLLTNVGPGKARLEGNVTLTFLADCDRCLTRLPLTLAIDFGQYVTAPDTGTSEEDGEDNSFMDGYLLDVEVFVYREIVLNWPTKILCRRDCKGICPKCGRNLNEGDCGCDTFVPDPRMAAIQNIFNANKEV